MSTQNADWTWLFQICVKEKFRFLPGTDGQPWVEYAVVAHLTGNEISQIERKYRGMRRHPAFAGFVRMTDLESIGGEKEDSSGT